ncbi:hypothetical protein Tco_1483421 [Tanacetum coccineum]
MLMKPQFFYDYTTKQALGFQNPFYLKKGQRLEPKLYDDPTLSSRPTKVEVPKEHPKVSMVIRALKILKQHLACYTALEKHCISLEVDTQLNQEIFQRDNSVSNQSAPSFDQYFEINELKAQSQEKDTVIKKLKERIKSLSENMNEDKVKKDIEEIETINIKLDHRVSKLIAENEHLKQTYKQLYDSIKPTAISIKEQCDALVNQVNQKSMEISDLNLMIVDITDTDSGLLVYVSDTVLGPISKSEIHDLCIEQYLSEVNDRARAKAVKSIKLKEWKPTGKIFTSTKIVPPRKPVKSTVVTNQKPSSASQWRPKETNHASTSSAPKIVESRTANHLEPNNHMGSNVSISLCSSSIQCSVDHPTPKVIAPIAEVVAPEHAASTSSPSSTTVDQVAPSPSNSQTTPETQSPVIPNDVEEDNHDLDISHMNNDPFFGIPIPKNDSEASSSDVIPTVVHTATLT